MRYSLPLFGLLFGSTILGAPTSVPNDCSASTCSKAQPESVENNAVITGSGFISQKTNMGIIGEEGDEFGDSFGGGELDNNDVIVSQGSTNGVAGGCKPGGTTECPTASASEVGKGSKVVTSPKPVIPKGQSEANTIKGTPVATGQVGNVKSAAPAASRIGLESVPPTTVKPASSAASPIGVKSAPPAASPVGVKSAPPAASPIGVKSVPQATSLTTVKPASPAPSSTGAKPAPLAASSNNVKSASPAASLTGAKPVSQAATSTQNAKPPLQTSGARTTSSVAPPTPAQVHLTSDLQQKKLAVPVTISPCENGCFPPQEILTMPCESCYFPSAPPRLPAFYDAFQTFYGEFCSRWATPAFVTVHTDWVEELTALTNEWISEYDACIAEEQAVLRATLTQLQAGLEYFAAVLQAEAVYAQPGACLANLAYLQGLCY